MHQSSILLSAGVILCAALAASCGGPAADKSSGPDGAQTAEQTAASGAVIDGGALTPPPPLPAACGAIGVAGYCGVAFGMTEAEANSAFPGGLHSDADYAAPGADCRYLQRAPGVFDVLFMFVGGRMERIDISAGAVATEAGAKVGMSYPAVEALYPGATRQPDFYSAPAENLVVELGDGVFALFEGDADNAVLTYHVGRKPPFDYVEGCS